MDGWGGNKYVKIIVSVQKKILFLLSLQSSGCARFDGTRVAFLLFCVLLFSIVLLKLHLFHSSLSLSLSIHSSLFISHSFVLFSSLFLFFSLLRFSWRVLTRRVRRRKQSARAKLFLSLSLSLVKNKKLQSVLHRGDGFGVQSFDFL